jgi:hypothetical protein
MFSSIMIQLYTHDFRQYFGPIPLNFLPVVKYPSIILLMKHPKFRLRLPFLALAVGCLLGWLSACGTLIPSPKTTTTPAPSLTPTAALIPTITTTATPQPAVAVLLAGPQADQAQVSQLQASLNDIVTAAGLRWQLRQQMAASDLTPSVRLVVAVPPDPGLAELVAAAPKTQFLALGISGLEAAPNLTTLDAGEEHPDQQGFIAGVIAAMLSDDWRVGAISLSDTLAGRAARTGFLNGVVYFCGLCRPAHPPFYEYPLYIELPSTSSSADWQEAANYMVDHYAQTVYVYPSAGDDNMLAILAQAGVNIISNGDPPDSARSSWVVSITSDPLPLIQTQVAGLLDGSLTGGQSLSVPIGFTQANPAVFTPGKQRLAQQVLVDLQSGFIDTSVDLTTGEDRP